MRRHGRHRPDHAVSMRRTAWSPSPVCATSCLAVPGNCNLHCVYCHNHRSDQLSEERLFSEFLDEKVQQVAHFQVGCIMEPTIGALLIFCWQSRSPQRELSILSYFKRTACSCIPTMPQRSSLRASQIFLSHWTLPTRSPKKNCAVA